MSFGSSFLGILVLEVVIWSILMSETTPTCLEVWRAPHGNPSWWRVLVVRAETTSDFISQWRERPVSFGSSFLGILVLEVVIWSILMSETTSRVPD
ncbi:hypothetical protein [Gulosibacter bifidus]|uniref:Uncharacterized protein n=1 Tax=Gulosibacter bifidus TaxID=272239 RepID=A0ABW5RJM7_9MICO|nr:hypothetical protein [Gulosibacter bifidus]